MKIKTSELSGIALDWAVAKANNIPVVISSGLVAIEDDGGFWLTVYSPSSDWSQGGPIIERERMIIWPDNGTNKGSEGWEAELGNCWFTGPTPLIAAMRCYVASKMGEEVEVPNDLLS